MISVCRICRISRVNRDRYVRAYDVINDIYVTSDLTFFSEYLLKYIEKEGLYVCKCMYDLKTRFTFD